MQLMLWTFLILTNYASGMIRTVWMYLHKQRYCIGLWSIAQMQIHFCMGLQRRKEMQLQAGALWKLPENRHVVAPIKSVDKSEVMRRVQRQRQSWNQKWRHRRLQVQGTQKRCENTAGHEDLGQQGTELNMAAACYACDPNARGIECVHVRGPNIVRTTAVVLGWTTTSAVPKECNIAQAGYHKLSKAVLPL